MMAFLYIILYIFIGTIIGPIFGNIINLVLEGKPLKFDNFSEDDIGIALFCTLIWPLMLVIGICVSIIYGINKLFAYCYNHFINKDKGKKMIEK